jgi:hypothetical protein
VLRSGISQQRDHLRDPRSANPAHPRHPRQILDLTGPDQVVYVVGHDEVPSPPRRPVRALSLGPEPGPRLLCGLSNGGRHQVIVRRQDLISRP